MQTLRFTTSINCGNCVRAVTPALNELAGAGNWQVDTAVPEKVLTVQSDKLTPEQVVAAVQEEGFEITEA
ncbi:heavy-metal-associated domain-containing protein [Hymenobacter sp. CRA2]|uniref:heavy-metal-associated domain-containing protein n=1 Tax=Hymenobacter sp. CRA2 TaxID=1955620 RepID=UPI00099025B7|nr:heavy-metal-associated domain-containing protein [Hymenobacter sp. CRA2]OON68741.1 hypothetical protein B0919_11160 [Hymenobacter sp. CRA2]